MPVYSRHRVMDIDPIPPLLLSLAIIVLAAKLGGHVAARFRQPQVVGELVAGLVLGNLGLLVGFSRLEYLKQDVALGTLAQFGVILLLFQAGLESTVGTMLKVGLSSLLVATLGVLGPFVFGWAVSAWLQPDASPYAHMFVGATLTATSVGITARVLKDVGKQETDEAHIILGAAVIDDIQGLIILAVVTGLAVAASHGEAASYAGFGGIVVRATFFLFGSLAFGIYLSPRLFGLASGLQASGVLLGIGLATCFFFAWAAHAMGLSPIVGAFAAGLILEDVHYRDFVGRGEPTLNQLVEPLVSFLAPVFFVLMGIRTDLSVFRHATVVGLATALTIAAIAGKQLCALGVIGKGRNRLSVGIGMIPRGEVGLIFANLGLTLMVNGQPLVDGSMFSALVAMIMVTTLVTPPALKWSFDRFGRSSVLRSAP